MSSSSEAAERPRLSVAILTQDEERNIARVMESVSWADEIVVLDSGSSDDTVAIARSMGARVVHEPFRGYGEQRRLSIENTRGEWVLALDADEAVTPELRDSILGVVSDEKSPCAGFECERHTCYLGAWFGSRGWHRDRIVRLVRRDRVIFDDRIIWERLAVDGPTARLSGPLLHWTYRDVSHHMRKMAEYSHLKAIQQFDSGRRAGLPTAVLHSAWRFFSGFVLKGGFLYGWPGLVYDLLGAHGTLLSYLKLSEMSDQERRESGGG